MKSAAKVRLAYRRLALWLDRRGWFSTWEHAMFDFENYGALRDRGLSHREAIAALNTEWSNRG